MSRPAIPKASRGSLGFHAPIGSSADKIFMGVRPRWRRRAGSAHRGAWPGGGRCGPPPAGSGTTRMSIAQRAVEQNLPRRGLEQVGAAHHLGDAHGRVVGHAGQLVAGTPPSPHHEIAKVFAGHEALRAQVPSSNSTTSPSGTRKRQLMPSGDSMSMAVGPGSCGARPR